MISRSEELPTRSSVPQPLAIRVPLLLSSQMSPSIIDDSINDTRNSQDPTYNRTSTSEEMREARSRLLMHSLERADLVVEKHSWYACEAMLCLMRLRWFPAVCCICCVRAWVQISLVGGY